MIKVVAAWTTAITHATKANLFIFCSLSEYTWGYHITFEPFAQTTDDGAGARKRAPHCFRMLPPFNKVHHVPIEQIEFLDLKVGQLHVHQLPLPPRAETAGILDDGVLVLA